MAVNNQILGDHRQRGAIDRGLTALFPQDDRSWSVTIRPSRVDARWTIEILARGQFWACSAGPAEQDPTSIVSLVRDALGEGLRPAPHSQE